MIRVYPLACALLLTASFSLCADTTVVDSKENYSVYLPDNWVRDVQSDSEHFFVDTTYRHPALLSLRRYEIDTSVYASGDEWTRSHFTAYKLTVQYSVDPAGVVLYSSADSTVVQGTLQAAEAYSVFFSYDTSLGAWAEYIRFTASGTRGYELYAITDTGDMSQNIGFYAAILQGIRFSPSSHVKEPPAPAFSARARQVQDEMAPYLFDPLGRRIAEANETRYRSSGMYFRKKGAPGPFVR
jgi:hypothetical protein